MTHDRPRRMLTPAPFVTLAGLVLLAAPALAGERGGWTYSLSVGTSTFDQRIFRPSVIALPAAGSAQWGGGFTTSYSVGAAAELMLNPKSWGFYEAGYRSYRQSTEEPYPFVPTLPARTDRRVDFYSMGAGVRFHPWNSSTQARGPYMQVAPTLFFGKWREGEGDQNVPRHVLVGVAAGVGIRGNVTNALGTDVGLRWTISDSPGDRSWSGGQSGLQELALVAGVAWSP